MAEKINRGISVVVPLYQCFDSLDELHDRLLSTLSRLFLDYEVIYVNDGSTDLTSSWLDSIGEDNKIRCITLSRNFGQHPAIFAGLSVASHEYICVMDGDLQDRPEEIEVLYDAIRHDPSIGSVVGKRINRLDNKFKIFFSNFFYKILAYLTETKLQGGIANFGIYRHKVIQEVLLMGDYNLFFPVMVQWVGFKYVSIGINHDARRHGKSSYNFVKLMKLAISIIVSFSNKPIYLIIKFGLLLSLISILMMFTIIFGKLVYGTIMPGWASLIVVSLFFGAIQISIMGIIGLYVSSAFERIKGRQKYIIYKDKNL